MNFDINIKSDIIAKPSPDFDNIQAKAVAGMTEQELVERHVIGQYENETEEKKESNQSKEEKEEA